jgi:hypothetical protein
MLRCSLISSSFAQIIFKLVFFEEGEGVEEIIYLDPFLDLFLS